MFEILAASFCSPEVIVSDSGMKGSCAIRTNAQLPELGISFSTSPQAHIGNSVDSGFQRENGRETLEYLLAEEKATKQSVLFPKLQMLPIDNSKKNEKEKREIPRRHKPVVQRQGHRVPKVQAELEEQGLQKLDNQ